LFHIEKRTESMSALVVLSVLVLFCTVPVHLQRCPGDVVPGPPCNHGQCPSRFECRRIPGFSSQVCCPSFQADDQRCPNGEFGQPCGEGNFCSGGLICQLIAPGLQPICCRASFSTKAGRCPTDQLVPSNRPPCQADGFCEGKQKCCRTRGGNQGCVNPGCPDGSISTNSCNRRNSDQDCSSGFFCSSLGPQADPLGVCCTFSQGSAFGSGADLASNSLHNGNDDNATAIDSGSANNFTDLNSAKNSSDFSSSKNSSDFSSAKNV